MSVLGKDDEHNHHTHQVSPTRHALARGNRYRNYQAGVGGVGVSSTGDEGLLYDDGEERHSMASISSFVVLAEADALLNEFRDSFMVASEGGHHTSSSQSQLSFAALGSHDLVSRHKHNHHQQHHHHRQDDHRQSTTNHYYPPSSSTKDDEIADHSMLLSPPPPSSSDTQSSLNQSSSSQRRLIASLSGGIGTDSLFHGANTSQGGGSTGPTGASPSPGAVTGGTEEQEVFSFLEKYSDKLVEMVSKKVEAKAAAAAAVLAASITSDNTSK